MKKAKNAKETQEDINRVFDVIIVGTGPAGLRAAREELARNPNVSILCLEATDRLGGRAVSGLHLVPASLVPQQDKDFSWSAPLKPAQVKWDRQWISSDTVDWKHKDWVATLPQWGLCFREPMVALRALPTNAFDFSDRVVFRLNCPVNKLTPTNDSATDGWQFETPLGSFVSRRAVWAAGLTAFQNAFGKKEAQAFLKPNPFHDASAADFRGGVAVTLQYAHKPEFEEGVPEDSVFALPVKHGGRYHLILGCLQATDNGAWEIQTLTHVNRDLLTQPQDVMSFQKSLRRALKSLLKGQDSESDSAESTAKPTEKWVVSDRVMGHAFGTPWLLGERMSETFAFAGDECVASCSATCQDTAGVLQSTPLSS